MISIVITAYKESKTVGKAIESVLQNEISEKFEIIMLAPDHETLDVAKRYAKEYEQVKVVKDKGEGKPSALNLAFALAQGRILILTDGDVFIKKNAIPLILKKFEDKRTGAVSGRPISINDRESMLGFWSHVLSDIADKRRKRSLELKERIFCSGYLYAIRAGIVREIPTETLSEDGFISHIVYEAGYKIGYCPEAEVYIKYPTKFKDWIIQKKRSTGGYNQIRMWIGKEIRSFKKESLGILDVLSYPESIKEFFYTFVLIFARLYLWLLIFIDINIKKKELKKIWKRVESTK